jgi:hypothetical protein
MSEEVSPELVLIILSFLPPQDLLNNELVCSKWNELIRQTSWRSSERNHVHIKAGN